MFNIGLPDRLVQFEKHIQCPEVPLHLPKNGSRVLVSLGVASFTSWMRLGTLYSRSLRPVINTGRCYRTSNGHRISLSHRSEPSKGVFRPKICSARYIRPKIPVCIKKCLEWGFGYKKSEYEINFGRVRYNFLAKKRSWSSECRFWNFVSCIYCMKMTFDTYFVLRQVCSSKLK